MVEKAKGGKKNRKVGRNANYCKFYKLSHRREHNKIRRLKKHLILHVGDKVAQSSLNHCKTMLGIQG